MLPDRSACMLMFFLHAEAASSHGWAQAAACQRSGRVEEKIQYDHALLKLVFGESLTVFIVSCELDQRIPYEAVVHRAEIVRLRQLLQRLRQSM